MHAPVAGTSKQQFAREPKTIAVAIGTALIATSLFGLLENKYQEIDEIRDHSLLLLWGVVNLPALILFTFTFDEVGFKAGLYLCVFIQWLGIGSILGLIWQEAAKRQATAKTERFQAVDRR